MSYDLKFEEKDNILWVTATGTRSLPTVLEMTKDIFKECARSQIKRVLFNVCSMEGSLSRIDAYEIPARYLTAMRDRSILTKIAIVELKEFEDIFKFFENVAVNRGLMLRIFSDLNEALEWLNK